MRSTALGVYMMTTHARNPDFTPTVMGPQLPPPTPTDGYNRSMFCVSCEVGWYGPLESSCWVCDNVGKVRYGPGS